MDIKIEQAELSVDARLLMKYIDATLEAEFQRHMRNGDIDKKTYEMACEDVERAIEDLFTSKLRKSITG